MIIETFNYIIPSLFHQQKKEKNKFFSKQAKTQKRKNTFFHIKKRVCPPLLGVIPLRRLSHGCLAAACESPKFSASDHKSPLAVSVAVLGALFRCTPLPMNYSI
jgi:hypothetical protein